MVRYCLNIFAIAALLILNSCSKEKSLVKEGVALQISPAIGEITKTLVDDSNISSKEIGIQITNQAGTQLYDGNGVYANMRLFKPAGSWFFDNGAGLPREVTVNGENAKIYAYYPFTSNPANFVGTGEASVLMVNIPKEHKKDSIPDYLWCAQDKTPPSGGSAINSNNASVQLKMNHSLSMIAFVFYKSGYEQAGNITRMEIKSTSGNNIFMVNKEGINDLRMKLSNGEFIGGSMVSSITLTNINSNIALSSDPGIIPATLFPQRNFQMLLVPATVANRDDIEFTFTIDGSVYTTKFQGSDALNLTPGNACILTVKLSPKSLNITGVSEWNLVSYEVSSGYEDLWYGMQPVQIGSLLWAPLNAGSDPTHPYGLLYQWHRKYGQGYPGETPSYSTSSGPVTILDANNINNRNIFFTNSTSPYDVINPPQSSWNMANENNPCPEGWRIPTADEFQGLINSGYTYTDSGLNNLMGLWFGGNHSTDRTGSLFIPFGGYTNEAGTSLGRFSTPRGMYWSNTTSGDDAMLFFTNNTSATLFNQRKARGHSIRCVKSL
ncbi:MAG: fimbrillin family protein [Bacteroidales bacterium]|nr:fimbrillin family protein [Bacteroidales bacterium]